MEALQRSETFAVGDAARLKLTNIRGRVSIQAGAPGEIAVTAVMRDEALAAATSIELSQAANGTVSVETHFPSSHGWRALTGRGQPSRVDYTVRVPPACSVELSVVECDTLVQGLTGEFNLHTVSGNLRLADLAGRLRVHTVSGSVFGERITAAGPVSLNAVSGSITLLAADLPAASATTVSGDLNLQTRLGAGPYEFNSVSGDIRLSVPAGTRCAVSLHSQSGRIYSRLPFNRQPGEGQAPTVRLHSVSGSLWLLDPDDPAEVTAATANAAEPPAPPAPPAAPARRAVLERIARGELSIDEGVTALKSH